MRVTLARLRERGWFYVVHEGRESIYEISGSGIASIHDAALRIHHASTAPWTGDWAMVIYTVPESDRQTRDELRKQLMWLGFGPLAPATWIRPRAHLDDISSATAHLSSAKLTLLTTRTTDLDADKSLVERCWDLESLGKDYDTFVTWIRDHHEEFAAAAADPHQALKYRIDLVHTYREFGRRDPHLPRDLQPADWSGEVARDLFEQTHALLAKSSKELYRHLFL
jgi:phenylacetic acid degradation operon negative regulatory protein